MLSVPTRFLDYANFFLIKSPFEIQIRFSDRSMKRSINEQEYVGAHSLLKADISGMNNSYEHRVEGR